uniref:TCF3 fusion partner n=1 Tax=Myotis myotis TaxID=51298 RepID=A0A7J7VI80_MYOMY|nr:hypothetical protein mMyoMyo1_008318 [Myotis myotis]
MELEQREGSMAAVGFEEFSAPPCSELALPPLFGGHILESELETKVEFVSGGLGSSSLQERDEEEERITRRLQQERRFLMKVLDSYGDDYWASQFTILLEDESSQGTDAPPQAMLRMSLWRKRACSCPGGHQRLQKPAARPLVRGPAVGRGRSAKGRVLGGSPADSGSGPHADKGGGRLWLQSGRGSGLKLGFSGARQAAALSQPSQLPL